MTKHNKPILLFDLGGVLVQTNGGSALRNLLPHLDEPEILRRWQSSHAVDLFERGRIGDDEFARLFVQEWALDLESSEFVSAFAGWVTGFLPGALELLARLRPHFRTACLSNTNAIHWARMPEVEQCFDVRLASHLTGHMKPEPDAYRHALEVLGTQPESVHFFDDLPENVIAAQRAGMCAYRVCGVAEAESTLRQIGFIANGAPQGI